MRRRLSGLGAGDPMYQVFQDQLLVYKNLLIKLYRQKASVSSEREALRFQYIAGMKAKINSAIGDMLASSYITISSFGTIENDSLLRLLLNLVRSQIPMSDMSGVKLGEWGNIPGYVGGRLNVSFLSPLIDILVTPFDDQRYSTNTTPAYKIYSSTFARSQWSDPNKFVDDFFLHLTLNQAGGIGVARISIPFTKEFVESYLRVYAKPQGLISQFDQVNIDIQKPLASGKVFKEIIDEARELLFNIIVKTQQVVQIQLDIDTAEADLADLVETYKESYAQGIILGDYLKELEDEANKPEPVEIPAVASTPVEVVSEQVVPVEAPKSKLPWIAAAVAGAFLLTRK